MEAELIPGLPDDIALECLLRLPFQAFASARRVCKRWWQEMTSPSFYRLRKASGHARPLVALIQLHRSGGLGYKNLILFEPTTGVWTPLPAVFKWSAGYCEVVSAGHELSVVCRSRRSPSVGRILGYNLLTGVWRLDVTTPSPQSLQSALVYDLEGRPLKRLPMMARHGRECRGFFFNGEFFEIRRMLWIREFHVASGRRRQRRMVSILEEDKWRQVALPAELTDRVESYSSFQL
ncbi:F-box/kelch-repeat protein At1g80440-like [Curcuma longa]|uniref:F-box/kelch-repeat protein At1g80440-like n=1 Tax=Curcuma longa TaxID=136217 RepID=UPI003D9F6AAF